jgi:hypothetical protein
MDWDAVYAEKKAGMSLSDLAARHKIDLRKFRARWYAVLPDLKKKYMEVKS